ncbi:hypothetical protein [Burkholderia seminalis]|uniref:hypothetical protein n=1 Tax=Burkholderia seminalis TaxID=488731 RepID=UPI000F5B4A29|nr:hypothetical protein [Burkholderia seminalis]
MSNDDAITRAKRILDLVDVYHARPDGGNRHALRSLLLDEFQDAARAPAQAAEPVAQWQYSVLTPGYEGDWHNCNAETAQRLQQPDLADFYKVRALYAAPQPPAQVPRPEPRAEVTDSRPRCCSGDPVSCPDNEGTGCWCSDAARAGGV